MFRYYDNILYKYLEIMIVKQMRVFNTYNQVLLICWIILLLI